jgi:DNA-binding IclR family transcriptional regulator
MTQGRSIGKRIRDVCALLEDNGPCTATELHPYSDLPRTQMNKYLRRAVSHELASEADGVYTVNPRWWALVDAKKERAQIRAATAAPKPLPANSVFQMADRMAA